MNKSKEEIIQIYLRLLDCFSSGVDEVIYRCAVELARQRGGKSTENPVRVDQQDVMRAAELIFDSIREHIGANPETAVVFNRFQDMYQCLMARCKTPGDWER